MNFKLIGISLIAIMLSISGTAFASEVIVIGNKSITESSLKMQDIKNIYLGKKSSWSDNKKIVFVIQDSSNVSDQFFSDYVKKSSSQFSSYWKEKVFTGQGTPPKSFASDKDMIQFISQTEGAIGYVSSSEGLDNVKKFTIE